MVDIHPVLQELIEDATEGLSLIETVRLRKIMIERILGASLCGTITPNAAIEVCQQVLVEDTARLNTLIEAALST